MNIDELRETILQKHGPDFTDRLISVTAEQIYEIFLGCLSVEMDPASWKVSEISSYAPTHADVKCGAHFIALSSKIETARLLALAPRMVVTILRQQEEINRLKNNI